jgi:putative ABC transport system permease protein
MRILLDIVRQSLSTLWAHKLRSFLTMFGIAWGVGSLLLLVGLGEGFRSGQDKNLAELGQDIMFVFPGRVPAVAGSYQSGQPYYLTYGDYFAIRDQSRFLRAVSPVLERDDIRAVSDYGSTGGQVFGVTPEYSQIRNTPIEPGRWFNDEDNVQHRRVAVVGWELLKNMFPGQAAVGSTILLNDLDFKVIGVIPKIGKEGETARITASLFPSKPCAVPSRSSRKILKTLSPSSTTGPSRESCISKLRKKCTPSSASVMASTPRLTTRLMTGTPSTARSVWQKSLTPWIGF